MTRKDDKCLGALTQTFERCSEWRDEFTFLLAYCLKLQCALHTSLQFHYSEENVSEFTCAKNRESGNNRWNRKWKSHVFRWIQKSINSGSFVAVYWTKRKIIYLLSRRPCRTDGIRQCQVCCGDKQQEYEGWLLQGKTTIEGKKTWRLNWYFDEVATSAC